MVPPSRIVCLTEETVETLYLLGEDARIVGVSGYAVRPPQVRKEKPRVSAFISADIPKILALRPDLVVTKDSVGAQVSNDQGGSIPSIDTRAIQTQVLVDNGQTVVLGGIYETEESEDISKVPFLGDIPGLGALFRSTRKVSNKSELLIFVTPKILKEGSNIY